MTDIGTQPRRTRFRRRSLRIDRERIARRVVEFYDRDRIHNEIDRELRLQREAKLRLWRSGRSWPWPDASDVAIPDMLEKSLRTQDTLHNAVMSRRPTVNAKSLHKADREKEPVVDALIDYQVFEEQPGEQIIGELASAFTDEGVFTAYVPWVREKRDIVLTQKFEPIPDDVGPAQHFLAIIRQIFPGAVALPVNPQDPWDWDVTQFQEGLEDDEPDRVRVSFYTEPGTGRIEVVRKQNVVVYDGPRVIPVEYDDVFHPPRAGNLQIPGPSNPRGASHVIIRMTPSVDSIRRMAKQGYYDLITKEELDSLPQVPDSLPDEQRREKFRDDMQGITDGERQPKPEGHRSVTMLLCFDMYDIDGDGIEEDVVWWVLLKPRVLLKAKALTEVFPFNPPRRPLAEAAFLPVRGRRVGISLPELVEGLHDAMKAILDQSIDSGTLQNSPWGFYRPSGSVNPRIITMSPGELYPLANPQQDVSFPQFNNNATAFGVNMLTLLGDMQDRVTLISELELGQVPSGKSAALRTASGIAQLSAKGEARPERILRRFFLGITQIWSLIHEQNMHFLPDEKKIRMIGIKSAAEDPYQVITDKFVVSGKFSFKFSANIFNSSKEAMQQGLGVLLGVYVNPLTLQLGAIRPEGVYRMLRDYGDALGQDADKYLSPPSPGASRPRILAEEALEQIVNNEVPDGHPAEEGGWVEHFQKLNAFVESDNFGYLSEQQIELLFKPYVAKVMEEARAQLQQMRTLEAAAEFAQAQGRGQAGRPAEGGAPNVRRPFVSGGNEMIGIGEQMDRNA